MLRCRVKALYLRPNTSARFNSARASQPGHDRKISAPSNQQGVLHLEPSGFAASPGFDGREVHTAPTLLIAGAVERPKLEVADIFRRYGEACRQQHDGSLSTAQRRVMTAIEVCRTSALGGHLERCDSCGHERPCYDSCLMESNFYWRVTVSPVPPCGGLNRVSMIC